MLSLRSAVDNPAPKLANVYFDEDAHEGFDSLGWADDSGIFAFLPLQKFDEWLDLLKSDKQASVLWIADGNNGDLQVVQLTNSEDPMHALRGEWSSERVKALPPHVRQLVTGTTNP